MKLSAYAHEPGISDRTAWRWFKAGKITGFPVDTGTILVTTPMMTIATAAVHPKTVIYTRISESENKDNLEGQVKRLMGYCAAKGSRIAAVVKEIGSGVNDTRPKLLKLLTDPVICLIVVEHQDRQTCFGVNIIAQWLGMQGRQIEVVNLAENGKEELLQEFVSFVTSFCAQLDGPRRSKRKTARILAELQHEEGHHPPQA